MVDWLLPKPSRFFSLILQQLLLDLKFHPFESKAQISPFKILTDSKIRFFLKNSTFDWIRDLHLIFLTQEHLLHQRKQCLEHKILPFQKESLKLLTSIVKELNLVINHTRTNFSDSPFHFEAKLLAETLKNVVFPCYTKKCFYIN